MIYFKERFVREKIKKQTCLEFYDKVLWTSFPSNWGLEQYVKILRALFSIPVKCSFLSQRWLEQRGQKYLYMLFGGPMTWVGWRRNKSENSRCSKVPWQ